MTVITSILTDAANTNKQLRHYDKDGNFLRLSVDETIAYNLNQWEGWTCSAGTNGLYIDFDGNVWICNTASASIDRYNTKGFKDKKFNEWLVEFKEKLANGSAKRDDWTAFYSDKIVRFNKSDYSVSKIFDEPLPGLLGNIFAGFDLPKQHSKCQWKCCGCGADVFLAKAKTQQDMDHLTVFNKGYNGQYETQKNLIDHMNKEDMVGMELNFPMRYQILWDLGRNCNYDCSYCWPSVHNRDAPHKSLDVLKATADKLITQWSGNEPIRWNFGGGEPTINPYFIDFLKYLKDHNQWTLITTNGSRPRKYWKEAVKYINSVNLSVHFEFVDETKLVGNIEEICNHFDEHDDDHWLEIKLMSTPKSIERAVALRNTIRDNTSINSVGANNRIKGVVSLVPIRSIGDSGAMVEYTEEQLHLLQQQ